MAIEAPRPACECIARCSRFGECIMLLCQSLLKDFGSRDYCIHWTKEDGWLVLARLDDGEYVWPVQRASARFALHYNTSTGHNVRVAYLSDAVLVDWLLPRGITRYEGESTNGESED